jgi:catechol 2,3-dioxygenase-like lactoylglutathione lyase family enzyme
MSTYPRTFSHIGISVPDVEKAAKFYSDGVLASHNGTTIITEESDTPIGQICIDMLGAFSKSLTCQLVKKSG